MGGQSSKCNVFTNVPIYLLALSGWKQEKAVRKQELNNQ